MIQRLKHILLLLIAAHLPTLARADEKLAGERAEGDTAQPDRQVIYAGVEGDYPPYSMVTEGRADGFSVELFHAVLTTMDKEAVFKPGTWKHLMKDLAEGRIEALPLVGRTPEREDLFDFTFPYLTMHGVIVTRINAQGISTPADLKGRTVAVMAGDNADEYLRRTDLGATIVTRPSFDIALKELSQGQHDAVVIQKLVALRLIKENNLRNLQSVGPPILDFQQNFCFAVQKGNSGLLATLNEGLAIVMADGTFRKLHSKWFKELTTPERIRTRLVVGGDCDYPPFEFLDKNGKPAGLNVELTQAIAKRMGLSIDLRLDIWKNVRQGLEDGSIDVVLGMLYSADRSNQLSFSPPGSTVQYSIVTRKGSRNINGIHDLAGKQVIIVAGDIMEELIAKMGHKDLLVIVPTKEEALRLLSQGHHDCALLAKVPSLYWIRKHGWSNLNVSRKSIFSADDCFAVKKGQEELLDLFSEGLIDFKTTGEFRALQSKWLSSYEEPTLHMRTFLRYMLGILFIFLLIFGGVLTWTRTLKHKVEQQTKELTIEIAAHKQAEEQAQQALNEQKKAADLLKESEARFRTLADSGQALIWTSGLDKCCDYFNAPWFAFTGRTLENSLGGKWAECIHPDDLEHYVERYNDAFDKQEHFTIDFRMRRHDGRYRSIRSVNAPRHDANGRFIGYIGQALDITEQLEMSAQLQQSQKMDSIGRLAGGIAHDFNNMLSVILGNVELAIEDTGPENPLYADLISIQKAAKRSAELTRQLLAFASKQTISPKVINLNDTMNNMVNLLRRLIGENIELVCHPAKNIWPIKIDATQIDQIITNLSVNARDAISGTGKLIIETWNASVDAEYCTDFNDATPGDYVVLSVSDNGCGIDKASLPYLFEPFFTTKKTGQGTGLGLATVYGIVRQNQGFISVYSELGHGSTFKIHLPRHIGTEESARPSDSGTVIQRGNETILVIEDEPEILKITQHMLQKLGYRVHVANTPNIAFQLMEQHVADVNLVITDVIMPEMNGREVVNRLSKRYPELKFLFMSGYTASVIAHQNVLDSGMHFIQKPFALKTLAAKVRESLDNAPAPDQQPT